jgi:hypothetical protein
MPHPTQACSSKVKVETPGKYLNFSIYFFLAKLKDRQAKADPTHTTIVSSPAAI